MHRISKAGYWLGLLAGALYFINPMTGILSWFTLMLLFIYWCFEVNLRKRMQYGRQFREQQRTNPLRELQRVTLPYTKLLSGVGVRLAAVLPTLINVIVGGLLLTAAVKRAEEGAYLVLCLVDVVPRELYFSVGIPLYLLATACSIGMSAALWRRCTAIESI